MVLTLPSSRPSPSYPPLPHPAILPSLTFPSSPPSPHHPRVPHPSIFFFLKIWEKRRDHSREHNFCSCNSFPELEHPQSRMRWLCRWFSLALLLFSSLPCSVIPPVLWLSLSPLQPHLQVSEAGQSSLQHWDVLMGLEMGTVKGWLEKW